MSLAIQVSDESVEEILCESECQENTASAQIPSANQDFNIEDSKSTNSSSRLPVENDERPPSDLVEPSLDQSKVVLKSTRIKLKNGKYAEIPHVLDGFIMLNYGPASDPEDVYVLKIEDRSLRHVIEEDLQLFTNLHSLYIGENQLSSSMCLASLGALPNLRKLYMQFNGITDLDLDIENRFPFLEELDVSYNSLSDAAILVLSAVLPKLVKLDLTGNNLYYLPPEIGFDISNWKERVIELLLPEQVAEIDRMRNTKSPAMVALLRKKMLESVTNSRVMSAQSRTGGDIKLSRPVSSISGKIVEASNILNYNINSQQQDNIEKFSQIPKNFITTILGFPVLEHLVLEKNNFTDHTVFEILGRLPRLEDFWLKTLNLNRNRIKSLDCFASETSSDCTPVPGIQTPKNITQQKYDGFWMLEELRLTHNHIDTPAGLMGAVWLPKLARIYLEGNPIMQKGGGLIELNSPVADQTNKSSGNNIKQIKNEAISLNRRILHT
ncbi:X-ray radiation resistance-associated protein 1 [Nowakowskiella sp. JEL0078]|nr:X-ray radiation resistance-associated protein 1 [Nowakowskiella sp. JEL0078]